jgi:anti-anti-sigma factor
MGDLQPASVSYRDGECVVALRGEIDSTCCEQATAVAVEAINSCPAASARIVVDLADVTFLDSSGIGTLVSIRNAGLARGIPTVLERVPAPVQRVLEIVGLAELVLPDDEAAASSG